MTTNIWKLQCLHVAHYSESALTLLLKKNFKWAIVESMSIYAASIWQIKLFAWSIRPLHMWTRGISLAMQHWYWSYIKNRHWQTLSSTSDEHRSRHRIFSKNYSLDKCENGNSSIQWKSNAMAFDLSNPTFHHCKSSATACVSLPATQQLINGSQFIPRCEF